MRYVLRKLCLDFALELVVQHVGLGDSQHAVLHEEFGIVFPELVQKHFVSLSDVILGGRNHEKQDGVALDVPEESHSDSLALVCTFDDSRNVSHNEGLVVIVAYDSEIRLKSTRSPEMVEFLESPKFNYKMALVDDLYNIDDEIIKISMIVLNGEDTVAMFRKVRAALDESLNLVTSGEGCMDTGIYGVNKGTAVEALQELWGITPEETMVFGDQYNDVDMFDRAHYSFAMAGAVEGVKKKARFIAGSNNEGGVVKAIREITGV